MLLVKIENNIVKDYPYLYSRLRKDFPNTSFPEKPNEEAYKYLEFLGVFRVKQISCPVYDAKIYSLLECTPLRNEQGEWEQTWALAPLPGTGDI